MSRTPNLSPPLRFLRAVTWMLQILLSLVAVLSLFTWRFDLWIDLRWAGPFLMRTIPWIWVASVLAVPVYSGPVLRGFRKPTWFNRPASVRAARLLLLPSVIMIALLLYNTVRFYQLFHNELIGQPTEYPITLQMAGVLILWCACILLWTAFAPRQRESTPVSRITQTMAYAYGTLTAVLITAAIFLHCTQRPPEEPVDVAVILGNRVLPGNIASILLRERTLVAIDLYHRGLARQILLSGVPEQFHDGSWGSETDAMLKVCLDHGVPRDAITLDPLGINTRATAANTRQFMQDHHYRTVVACSSASHLLRCRESFKEVGIDAYTAASDPQVWTPADLSVIEREFAGLVVYAVDPKYRPAKAVEMNLKSPHVIVTKKNNTLELFDGPKLVKTYPCITGSNPGDKGVEGDRKTPIGTFHIVFRNPDSKYHLSLGLDYPNRPAADRGLQAGLITKPQYDEILAALASDLTLEENQKRLWYSPLGGEIFLHGHAEGRTGTAGCVALSNRDIEELYSVLPLGTEVEIRE